MAKALQPQLTRARTDKAYALGFNFCIKQIKKPQVVAFLFADGRSRTGTRRKPHKILSLARLPISSHRQVSRVLLSYQKQNKYQGFLYLIAQQGDFII